MPSTTPTPPSSPIPLTAVKTPSGALRPLLIAHRCGAGLGPENTCAALVQSSFHRPDFYEVDIRHTLDGVAVCLHDPNLDRTTDLSGNISDKTWAEISGADAGGWLSSTYTGEPLPGFERMLDCVNPAPLAIELKEPEISTDRIAALVAALDQHRDTSSVVMSFHTSALDAWRSTDSSHRRTVYLTVQVDDYALSGPNDVIGLSASSCSEENVKKIHAAGKAVWVWTVNDDFEDYIALGVDGIVTDQPDFLRRALPPS